MTLTEVRAKLATLGPERCWEKHDGAKCPGWFVSTDTHEIQRCDDCWSGHPNKLTDDEAALLPEAQAERKQEICLCHDCIDHSETTP